MKDICDRIYFLWKNGKDLDIRFSQFQGYEPGKIIAWKRQTGLSWSIVIKLLTKFEIYSAPRIREIISKVYSENEELFSRENCYVTSFGNAGKSGDVILYEFSHTKIINKINITKTWDIGSLPSGSTIIFVDDIIGTGEQSIEYINNQLNLILLPSHDAYLLSLCVSPQGLENVNNNTNFKVIYGDVLEECSHQFYSNKCNYFTRVEREKIIELNNRLKKSGGVDYDLGLMLAFHFTIPNNTMPIFWKHNYPYINKVGEKKKWNAIFPREF